MAALPAMGIVIVIKLVTSLAIVLSIAYFNWWLTSVYPDTHRVAGDPMGPFLWDFRMNVTNVSLVNNRTLSQVSFDAHIFGANRSRSVVVVTFAHPNDFRYALSRIRYT